MAFVRSSVRSLLAVTVLVGLLAGCGGASGAAGDQTVDSLTVTIAGGTVTPQPGRVPVARGREFTLTVVSDVFDRVHVHGPDVTGVVTPDTPAVIRVTFTEPGLYEVETHETALQLLQVIVR
jgi:plastocyanin